MAQTDYLETSVTNKNLRPVTSQKSEDINNAEEEAWKL
jgi:hypothetical protein